MDNLHKNWLLGYLLNSLIPLAMSYDELFNDWEPEGSDNDNATQRPRGASQ